MTGHALFAAALGLSWTNSALHVLWSDRPIYAPLASELMRPTRAGRSVVLAVATVGFAGLVWAWMAGTCPGLAAMGVLGALLALRQWEKRQWAGDVVVRLGKYVPAAACLTGWLCASALAMAAGWEAARADAAGWEAAAGVMAATYTLAALSKLRLTGWRWMAAPNQALLIAERAYSGPLWVRRARRAVSRSPRACRLVGVFGLAAELLFALFVFPELRVPLTVVVVALHFGIGVLLGYIELEWVMVMVGITVVTTP